MIKNTGKISTFLGLFLITISLLSRYESLGGSLFVKAIIITTVLSYILPDLAVAILASFGLLASIGLFYYSIALNLPIDYFFVTGALFLVISLFLFCVQPVKGQRVRDGGRHRKDASG